MSQSERRFLLFAFACLIAAIGLISWAEKVDPLPSTPKPTQSPLLKPRAAAQPKPIIKASPRASKTSRTQIRYRVQANTPSKRYAKGIVDPDQWGCLHELWMRESGWSPTSDNPTSSAYGIPQILGLEKRTGDDYRKQVDAGLAYIDHRYGTPCRAWSFWRSHRWY